METASNSLLLWPTPPTPPQPWRKHAKGVRWRLRGTEDHKVPVIAVGSTVPGDENMVVLRMRIREMTMEERNREAPGHWLDWEKQCHRTYDADVCEAVGALQRFLLNSRPSVALGQLVMVGMSVPTAAIVVLSNLFQVGNGIANAIVHH